MAILNTVRGWRASRRRREREAYADNFGHATPEEAAAIKRNRRRLFSLLRVRGGFMPDGRGISPTGTPMDFTADEEPPRH